MQWPIESSSKDDNWAFKIRKAEYYQYNTAKYGELGSTTSFQFSTLSIPKLGQGGPTGADVIWESNCTGCWTENGGVLSPSMLCAYLSVSAWSFAPPSTIRGKAMYTSGEVFPKFL